ncbi:MAG: arylsulfatase [Litorimonas sp.]
MSKLYDIIPLKIPIIAGIVILLGLQSCAQISEAPSLDNRPPNIVFVLTDDQGPGDIGYFQNPIVQTPNIDQLAEDSLRLTNFHVSPTCSPTRAALFSGQNSLKAGIWHTIKGRSLLSGDHYSMASALQDNGYKTGLFGKWHLGDNYPFRPQDHGFDEVLMHGGGGVGQQPDYWGNSQFDDTYFRNGEPERFEGYATEIWFDEAIKFIKRNKEQPFFAYISTNAPHHPFRAPESYIEPYRKYGFSEEGAGFYGMITSIDDQVGRLRAEIRDAGLEDNTIFIFATDNGSSVSDRRIVGKTHGVFRARIAEEEQFAGWVYNNGLRGYKNNVYEGGHRVPFLIRYPNGNFGNPKDINTLLTHYDLYPTLLDFASIDISAVKQKQDLDGLSFKPLLKASEPADKTTIDAFEDRIIMVTTQRVEEPSLERPIVLMTQKWRYVVIKNQEELFDIENDLGQDNNVGPDHPDVLAYFRDALPKVWADNSERFSTRQRIIIGNDQENPARLSGMDWSAIGGTDVPGNPGFAPGGKIKGGWFDNPEKYKPLPWSLTADQTARYEITGYVWDKPSGKAVGRAFMFVDVDGRTHKVAIENGATTAKITLPIEKGPLQLKVWFADNESGTTDRVAGLYAYVRRI